MATLTGRRRWLGAKLVCERRQPKFPTLGQADQDQDVQGRSEYSVKGQPGRQEWKHGRRMRPSLRAPGRSLPRSGSARLDWRCLRISVVECPNRHGKPNRKRHPPRPGPPSARARALRSSNSFRRRTSHHEHRLSRHQRSNTPHLGLGSPVDRSQWHLGFGQPSDGRQTSAVGAGPVGH